MLCPVQLKRRALGLLLKGGEMKKYLLLVVIFLFGCQSTGEPLYKVYLQLKEYDKALAYTDSLINSDYALMEDYYIKGYIYNEIGQDSLACETYLTGFSRFKDVLLDSFMTSNIYYREGIDLFQSKSFDDAESLLSKAAKQAIPGTSPKGKSNQRVRPHTM